MVSDSRPARPGERCTCGRQAIQVFVTKAGEVGYCGIPDRGDQSARCPFCGGERHEFAPCPEYRVSATPRPGAP